MKRVAIAFGAGLIFALGLGLSGMTNPAKVSGFLDLAGAWDPSLAFVMVGAIAVFMPAYRFGKGRTAGTRPAVYRLPTRPVGDPALLAGSAVFGIGWALSGYCPGPSFVATGASLLGAGSAVLVFVASMGVGMATFEGISRFRSGRRNESSIAK